MPLDNEIIKKMLEIIKNDHVLMLEIIKDNSLNNEEKSNSIYKLLKSNTNNAWYVW